MRKLIRTYLQAKAMLKCIEQINEWLDPNEFTSDMRAEMRVACRVMLRKIKG